MSQKFLVALHFEADVTIEAENEEEAIDKGRDMLDKRHVYQDDEIMRQLIRTYADGKLGRKPPVERPEFRGVGVAAISDPDYINDNEPVILEEVKDEKSDS